MSKNSSGGSLEDLGERLKKARGAQRGAPAKGPRPQGKMSGFAPALRVGAELVSALIVGVGLGWLLDTWLGTRPWLMIVFIFLGGAAGILNVYRFALRMEKETKVDMDEMK